MDPSSGHKFVHAGFSCLVIQMDMLGYFQDHHCGYVRVGEDHPWFLENDEDITVDVDVTYAGPDPRTMDQNGSKWWVGLYRGSFEDTVTATNRLAELAAYATTKVSQ